MVLVGRVDTARAIARGKDDGDLPRGQQVHQGVGKRPVKVDVQDGGVEDATIVLGHAHGFFQPADGADHDRAGAHEQVRKHFADEVIVLDNQDDPAFQPGADHGVSLEATTRIPLCDVSGMSMWQVTPLGRNTKVVLARKVKARARSSSSRPNPRGVGVSGMAAPLSTHSSTRWSWGWPASTVQRMSTLPVSLEKAPCLIAFVASSCSASATVCTASKPSRTLGPSK